MHTQNSQYQKPILTAIAYLTEEEFATQIAKALKDTGEISAEELGRQINSGLIFGGVPQYGVLAALNRGSQQVGAFKALNPAITGGREVNLAVLQQALPHDLTLITDLAVQGEGIHGNVVCLSATGQVDEQAISQIAEGIQATLQQGSAYTLPVCDYNPAEGQVPRVAYFATANGANRVGTPSPEAEGWFAEIHFTTAGRMFGLDTYAKFGWAQYDQATGKAQWTTMTPIELAQAAKKGLRR